MNVRLGKLPSNVGRRLSMDVNEDVLAQIGAKAVQHFTERIAAEFVYRHEDDVRRAVDTLLFDAAWLKPIVEQEIRRCAREFVLALWSDDEKKNMRDRLIYSP